ncbi:MAG: transcription-repair coupling factor [Defluviitaleaceae bacterium]|nr:transcription-repair coupling factor [Defluviitaleaceae bacterium]
MKLVKDFITHSNEFRALHQSLKTGHVLLSGVTPTFQGQLISVLAMTHDQPLLIVVRNEHDGRKLYDSLVEIEDTVDVNPFLLDELMTAHVLSASSELRFERLQTLKSLTKNPNQIVIANVGAVRRYLTPIEQLADAEVMLKVGTIYEPADLVQKVIRLGYQRVSTVVTVGEFSIRGGIIDIFPKEVEHPLRIEFFDDEVETIRSFDIQSQRSIQKVDHAEITLLYEFYFEESDASVFAQKIQPLLDKQLSSLTGESKDLLLTEVNKDISRIQSYSDLDLMHQYLSVMYEQPATICDYLKNPLVIWIDADKIALHAKATDEEFQIWQQSTTIRGERLAGFNMQALFSFHLAPTQLFLSEQTHRLETIQFSNLLNFMSKGVEEYHGNLELFTAQCAHLVTLHQTVVIVSESADLRNNLMNRFTQSGVLVLAVDPKKDGFKAGAVNVMNGSFEAGFELIDAQFVVYTETEIKAGARKRKSTYKGRVRDGQQVKDYTELQLGDFVVHLQHGIGRYVGVETIDMLGVKRDVLTLEYKRGDRVYVPIDKIDLVQKYVGSEGAVPKLSRLGGKDWEQAKASASKMVKDIAKELITVYAKRKYLPGFAFSKDSAIQREFEDSCEFVETADQLKTTAEIKADMEKPHPMDRLLIGDVGYGKTEVAMRAAMKAVADHKQVIYVAPTTILARQQYENFKKRFLNHPVEMRQLTRHVSDRDLEIIQKEIALGRVDILIGTHRVFSKSLIFKDLGLLIVDEEQRFGVEHKETIKQMKTDVDVLTLTATPIPRTLQMSMVGIRSLSLIETPPVNRYPVQTYVLETHDSVIRDAMERELARGGQVFYLHNRVTSLAAHVKKIQKLVPDARIGYAHGKMTREVLEDTMQDFEERRFDILVCTTIIETGIDIPNANTLIVGDAYRLGLSQMYQLRGRVGRSDRIAYAYFLYPQNYVLTENAEKRLQTIREFTALGSGFKIAMRDLAIRGAGDMLGTRQNGFLDTVGLDLYTKMLAEAIKVAENEEDLEAALANVDDLTSAMLAESARELDIGIGIDRYIPDSYIEDASLKIEMYKKMKALQHHQDYEELKLEFKDRFGNLPEGVENLVDLMYLKSLIAAVVESSRITKTTLEFTLTSESSRNIDVKVLYGKAAEIGKFIRVKFQDGKFQIIFDLPTSDEQAIPAAIALFEEIREV